MARFTATIRVLDVEAPDRVTARKLIESKLHGEAVGRYQIVAVEPSASPLPVRQPRPPARPRWVNTAIGPLLLLGAIAWTFWFYWLLFE